MRQARDTIAFVFLIISAQRPRGCSDLRLSLAPNAMTLPFHVYFLLYLLTTEKYPFSSSGRGVIPRADRDVCIRYIVDEGNASVCEITYGQHGLTEHAPK